MIGLLPLAGLIVVIGGTSLLLARCLAMARRDTNSPAAEESCGCRDVNVIYGCMHCGRSACAEHRAHVCPDRPFRADRAQMALQFRLLVDESLSDLRSVDADLAPLYVVPEVER